MTKTILPFVFVWILSNVQSEEISLPDDCSQIGRKTVSPDSEYTIKWNGGRFSTPCKIYLDNEESIRQICISPESYSVKDCRLKMTFSPQLSFSDLLLDAFNYKSEFPYPPAEKKKKGRSKGRNKDDDDDDSSSSSSSDPTPPVTYSCNEDPEEYCGKQHESLYIEIAATPQDSDGDSFTLKVYSSQFKFNLIIGLLVGLGVPLFIGSLVAAFFIWRWCRRRQREQRRRQRRQGEETGDEEDEDENDGVLEFMLCLCRTFAHVACSMKGGGGRRGGGGGGGGGEGDGEAGGSSCNSCIRDMLCEYLCGDDD